MNEAAQRLASLSGPDSPVEPAGARAVARAADVLLCFSHEHPSLSLGEIASLLELPKSTVHRIVGALCSRGLIAQERDGRYYPGLRLFELGSVASRSVSLARAFASQMRQLAAETGECVLLGEVDWFRGEIVIVGKQESAHPLQVLSRLGHRVSLGPGCLSMAALAGLPEAELDELLERIAAQQSSPLATHRARTAYRQRLEEIRVLGYAIEEGEFMPGVSGVGTWVHLGASRPAGAIGMVGPSERLRGAILERVGRRLREIAATVGFRTEGPKDVEADDEGQRVPPRVAASASNDHGGMRG